MRTQTRLEKISTAISLFGMAMGFSVLRFLIVVNQHDGGRPIKPLQRPSRGNGREAAIRPNNHRCTGKNPPFLAKRSGSELQDGFPRDDLQPFVPPDFPK